MSTSTREPGPAVSETAGRLASAPRPTTAMPSWIPRAILLGVVAFFGVLATRFLLGRLQNLLLTLVVALFLSFALEPAVNWLAARGWRRGAATGLVLLGLLALGGALLASMVPLVITQIQGLVTDLPGWLDRINRLSERWFNTSVSVSSLDASLASVGRNLAGALLGFGASVVSATFRVLTVGLFTFYLVAEGPRLRRAVCSLLRPERQREVLWAWDLAIDKTGGYLYSRLLLATISSVTTFLVLVVLGVPFALPLALWVGVISQFVPVVGTYVALAVPLLAALAQGPAAALVLLAFEVAYQQVENYVLGPRITARTMALHPAVAVGAVIAGGSLYGTIGALLSLPAAAIVQAGLSTYLTRHEVLDSELTRLDRS